MLAIGIPGFDLADQVDAIINGLEKWVVESATTVAIETFDGATQLTTPRLGTALFTGQGSAYATMLSVGASLMLFCFFAAVTQGVIAGEGLGVAKTMWKDAPVAVMLTLGTVAVVDVLMAFVDGVSDTLMYGELSRMNGFGEAIGGLSNVDDPNLGLVIPSLLLMLAAMAMVLLLAMRAAFIYVLVGLSPLLFAMHVWPATRDVATKTVRMLIAVIFSKLVGVLALSIGLAAIVEGFAINGEDALIIVVDAETPVDDDAEPTGPVTEADGFAASSAVLLGTASIFAALFAPMKLIQLAPGIDASAALAPGGLGRQAQTALSTTYYTKSAVGSSKGSTVAGGSSGTTTTNLRGGGGSNGTGYIGANNPTPPPSPSSAPVVPGPGDASQPGTPSTSTGSNSGGSSSVLIAPAAPPTGPDPQTPATARVSRSTPTGTSRPSPSSSDPKGST